MSGKFLPGTHPIEKFGGGGFRFGGMSHRGSLIILPSGMSALSGNDIESLPALDLDRLLAEREQIDLVLVGTGARMLRLPRHLADWFRSNAFRYDVMSTAAAVSTYNVLLAEERRIAALLFAVD